MEISNDLMHMPKNIAEYIALHGWVQGSMEDQKGRVCLLGALERVGGGFTDASRLPDQRIVGAVLSYRGFNPSWNDSPGRTVDQVVDALHGLMITESELAEVFGPDWEHVVTFYHTLHDRSLSRGAHYRNWASWDTKERGLVRGAFNSASTVLGLIRFMAIRNGLGSTGVALAARHLIGDVFTQAHYDYFTGPWRAEIGPIHPDDPR